MYLEVYIDIVFIINLVMDLVILWLVQVFSRRKVSFIRLFSGAIIGAIMMCIIVILPYHNFVFNMVLGYLVTSLLIVFITFKPTRMSELLKLTITMYIIAVMLGGIMFALYYYSYFGTTINQLISGSYKMDMKIGLFILILLFAVVIFRLISKIMTRTLSTNKNLFDIQININDTKISVNGLLDTGNNLYDPITKNPVIIGECELLKNILPEQKYKKLSNISNNIYEITDFIEFGKANRLKLRLIPFSSLGNENGMLLGIVTDTVSIYLGDKTKSFHDVVIAIYNKKLSNDNSYQVLIHPELIG